MNDRMDARSLKVPKSAALYARVSTLDQNCEVQLQDLRRMPGSALSFTANILM